MQQSAYLPFVDGLRAIAVLFVVIYHTDLGLLPGGFVGVDVFFVISGYLITNHLAKQIHDNSFTFRGFYTRRIRRLIPAYAAVSLTTLVAGYFLLLPKDYVYHVKLVGLAFLSVGNFYISNTTGGYFAPQSEEIPFLHTWSLAVEEQYYLVWPLLLLFGTKLFGNRLIIPVVFAALIASLVFSQHQAIHSPELAYYLLPARAYELLVGSLLALIQPRLPTIKPAMATFLSTLGLGAVAYSALFISSADTFPGYNGLIVCLGTALLIYAGFQANFWSRLLSTRWLVGIGKTSYSLYLWHWPVFSFMRYMEGSLSPGQVFFAIALSFGLSWLSWKYVETPFRTKWKFPFGKTLGIVYLAPLALIILVFVAVDSSDGIPSRFGEKQAQMEALQSAQNDYLENCGGFKQENCISVLLVGDSHANHFGPFIKALKPADVAIRLTTKSMAFCPPLKDLVPVEINQLGGQKIIDEKCLERNRTFYNELGEFDYIVFSGYWAIPVIENGRYFFADAGDEEFSVEKSMRVLRRTMLASIQAINDAGKPLVIIRDMPTIGEDMLKCSYKNLLFDSLDSSCFVTEEDVAIQNKEVEKVFTEVGQLYPNVVFIDPSRLICSMGRCDAVLEGVPLYKDEDHLNATGAHLLGSKFHNEFGSPFISD